MSEPKGHSKLLELAKKRFQLASDAESEIRKEALDDLKFRAGEQWPDAVKNQRETDKRPCLTINQMPQFIRQVTNDQRQNRPSIQVNPVDSSGDEDTAEILQGIVRHIEYESGADAAYDTGFQSAVTGGFGFIRANTKYCDPMSFEQDIVILRVRNPFTVYFDPACKEPDYSDANFAFVVEKMSKEEFKAEYPKAKLSLMEDWTSEGDGWIDESECRVAEYFYRESIKKTIVQLSDGSTMEKSLVPEVLPEGVTLVPGKERETQIFAVKWIKMTGDEVLEETDWLGKWIPIVPVLGDELDIDGKRVLEGIIRNAKDPQRQYNFMASATTETIALAPKAPFIGVTGQFASMSSQWQNANIANYPYLEYDNVSVNGTPAPPPQRQTFEPAIQATTMAMMQANQDLHSTTGIYQAALGEKGNETSGRGILARQQQSQGSNFHYVDNLSRALKHLGRIIIDLIPKVYDTERTIRIIGADGKQSVAKIGPGDPNAPQDAQVAKVDRIYDLSMGTYDVTISTGPSYQTKRQEAVSTQLELVKSFPPLMPVIGDILVRNMDIPGAEEMADRMEKMLPAQLQEQDGENGIPPQAQQAIAQMTQQNQELTQHLNAANEEIKNKTQQKQLELESKERMHFEALNVDREKIALDYERLRVSVVVADINSKAASAQSAMDNELAALGQMHEQAHEVAMSELQHEHGQEQMEQQGQQQSELQTQQAEQQPQPAQQ